MASANTDLLFILGFTVLVMALVVETYRGNTLTEEQWRRRTEWSLVAGIAAFVLANDATGGRGLMGANMRWERELIRWLMCLSVGLSVALCSFALLQYVPIMLLLGTAASIACAGVLVAVHLRLGRKMAISGA